MAKGEATVAKVPVHFIGFLANVDDSITKLQLGDGFVIESSSAPDVIAFLKCIGSFWGTCGRDDIPPGGAALVHKGARSSVDRRDVLELRQYVREAIKAAMSSGMSKDELLRTLNACGFGQRPWREEAK